MSLTITSPSAGASFQSSVPVTGTFSTTVDISKLPFGKNTITLPDFGGASVVVNRPYPCPVQPTFYGCNGHFDWGGSGVDRQGVQPSDYPTIIAAMQDVGVRTFRNGFGGGSSVATWIDFIDNHATPGGICVYPNIEGDFDPTQDGHTASEASAYTVGFTIGAMAAGLKGRVPWYEIGNEEDSYAIIDGGHSGTVPSDYDNRRFTICRGYYRGVIDGIRSVDLQTPIMMAGMTWIHTAFWDMLLAGTQPDGTGGHPVISFDIASLHWYTNNYSPNDDPENAQGMNLLAHAASWGKPIRITEFGANWDSYGSSESAVDSALLGPYLYQKWSGKAATYNIIGCDIYQIIDASGDASLPLSNREMNFGLLTYAGAQKTRYGQIKSFIASNPHS